jgi:3-oxoadipate enol-lactonase
VLDGVLTQGRYSQAMSNERLPALFLHAYPLNRAMWDAQIQAVEGAGWTAIAPDFPGFGNAPQQGEKTLEALADRALETLSAAGFERAVIVGLSMGGYVALRALDHAPDRIAALVLCDTKAGADTIEAAQKRLEAADRAEREGTGWMADAMLPNLVAANASDGVQDTVRSLIAQASPSGVANAQRAMAARPDSRPLLSRVRVPTLVLVGSEDALTPLAESVTMATAIPDAQLQVIPNAGHLSNLEQPAAFNRALLGFLRDLD